MLLSRHQQRGFGCCRSKHSQPRPSLLSTHAVAAPEALVDVHCAKSKCVHPGRPAEERCKDCPLRKQKKSMAALPSFEERLLQMEALVDVHCAKSKCVHPGRPADERCKDCPLRKQKKSMVALPSFETEQMASQEDVSRFENLLAIPCTLEAITTAEVVAVKTKKCIHPMRPLQGSCRDCPRRKGLRNALGEAQEEAATCKLSA